MNTFAMFIGLCCLIGGVGFLFWRALDRVEPWVARYHQNRDAREAMLRAANRGPR